MTPESRRSESAVRPGQVWEERESRYGHRRLRVLKTTEYMALMENVKSGRRSAVDRTRVPGRFRLVGADDA